MVKKDIRASADAPLRPFLRWAGSKRRLLNQIYPFLPRGFETYYEPFLGSGALFFSLRPEKALLSDKSRDLIGIYSAVRDNVSAILHYLKPLKPNRSLFYAIRNTPSIGRLKYAAEFLYLNKTCWNGLYRVNSHGKFNVPYGKPRSDFIADFENLRKCSKALQKPGISLDALDFEQALERVKAKDFVYLDPPYLTRHNNNSFVNYNEKLFSWEDQKRLARLARRLAKMGAYVLVTNADHSEVADLYKDFIKNTLIRRSTLAGDPDYRTQVKEAIFYSTNIEEEN